MQRALNRSLRQPALALLRANREKDPVWSIEQNMNPFGRRMTARFTERRFVHTEFLAERRRAEKNSRHPLNAVTRKTGRAAALPYQIKSPVGQRCRAAPISKKPLHPPKKPRRCSMADAAHISPCAPDNRIRNAPQVGRPPRKVFRLDELVTLDGFHKPDGKYFASAKVATRPTSRNVGSRKFSIEEDFFLLCRKYVLRVVDEGLRNFC